MRSAVILHGSNDIYGASRVLMCEVDILNELGYEVTILVPQDGPLQAMMADKIASVEVCEGLSVLRRSKVRDGLKLPILPDKVRSADRVVLWTLAMAPYVIPLQLARRPFYLSVHELLHGPMAKILLRLLSVGRFPITACSNAVRDWLIEDGAVAASRICVTYPVMEARQVVARRPRPVTTIAVVGRLNGHKGHLEVAQQFSSAALMNADIQLLLAGAPFPGQERHQVELLEMVRRDPRIRYLGEVSSFAEIAPQIDLLAAFPSMPEPFGLVPLEAWRHRIPTIGYVDGGSAEVLGIVGGIPIHRQLKGIGEALSLVIGRDDLPMLPAEDAVLTFFTASDRRAKLERILSSGEGREPF